MTINDQFTLEFKVTEEIYKVFTDVFKDKNPLHINSKFATDKGFKDKVMHGAILAGFLSYFIGEGLPDKNVIVQSYEIQFANPVYLNDVLSLKAKITDYFESVNTYQIKYGFYNSWEKLVAKGKIMVGKI
jgi:acyl dehydratase